MRFQRTTRAAIAAALTASLTVGGASWGDAIGADEPADKTVAEELLEILRAAGQISDEQYESLADRARKEEEARIEAAVERAVARVEETAANLPPVSEGPEDWEFEWSNGFKLERNDGQFEFKFGGRIQNDWAVIALEDDLEDYVGGEGNGVEFRRARIFFEGSAYEHLIFKWQMDFANTGDGTVDFKDVWMGLHDVGFDGDVIVGHHKEPFSLEEQGSSKYMTFLERALPNVFSPGRNTGLMARGGLLEQDLVWGVGVFKDTNDSGFGFDDNSLWNVTARVAGTPLYADDGERVVHLGFGYTHQFRGDDFMLRYRQRPEAHLANRFTDTGAIIATDDIDIINAELAWVQGPFSVQSEYMHSFVDGRDSEDVDFWGAYGQVSYFLTGEHRNYQHGKASFGRVKPKENFAPAKGQWGAWEIAARFSYLDLDDEYVNGGTMWDVTAGLNWYLYPNTRVMINYIHSQLNYRTVLGPPIIDNVDGAGDIAQVRFQVDF